MFVVCFLFNLQTRRIITMNPQSSQLHLVFLNLIIIIILNKLIVGTPIDSCVKRSDGAAAPLGGGCSLISRLQD